ncbi:MAG: PstS family phosphate ABC transporter substrate-binding protein [Gemmatimonadota bacterium]
MRAGSDILRGPGLSLAILCLSACGEAGSPPRVVVDGSSSMYPVAEAVAEDFQAASPGVRVTVGISGSGGGFQRFCAGEIDIANASRPMDTGEVESCAARGVDFRSIPIAWDGLSVVVNPRADFVECLTLGELSRIWGPDSTVRTWSDVRRDWPDVEITLYAPGPRSGTFDYFTEVVNGARGWSRPDFQASEDDNILVQGVAGDPYSLGYFAYAYYAENAELLRLVAVDSGEGCVLPSDRSIAEGRYTPLARLLYVYVREAALARAEVRGYLTYMLQGASELVPVTGYRALDPAQYANSLRDLPGSQGGAS